MIPPGQTNVLWEPEVSIFWVPEIEGNSFPQNVIIYLPDH